MGKQRLPNPEDVLGGRASADLSTLVGLVHQVNPTGRRLPPEEASRRYALKGGLQSLILRRYPDLVRIRPSVAEDEIAIDVPLDGRDAGHAPIASLDEDVRPWVRSVLAGSAVGPIAGSADQQQAPAGWAPPASDPQAALDAGDYEHAAVAWLALGRDGRVGAAREGLAVLVDWLGDVARAITERESLPRAVADDPVVRLVVARGLLQTGDTAGAEALAVDCVGSEAGALWAELATRRLASGDRAGARVALDRSVAADPATRQIVLDLTDQLRALDEAERTPLRRAVDRALADGAGVDEALSALEVAYPGDPYARAARTARERSLTAAAADARLAAIRSAVAQGAWDLADQLLAQLGSNERDHVAAELGPIGDAVHQGRQQQAVAAVAAAAQQTPTPAVVAAWLALDPDARDQARNAAASPRALDCAQEIASRVKRDVDTVARAACALAAASAHLAGGRDSDATAALHDHLDLVAATPTGRSVLETLRRRARDREVAAATAALEQARATMRQDPGAGLRLLEAASPSLLPDGLQRERAALLEDGTDRLRQHQRMALFERHLQSREPWRARDLARADGWDDGVRRATAAIRATLSLVDLGGGRELPPSPFASMLLADGLPIRAICADGRTAILGEAMGSVVVLHRVTLPDLVTSGSVCLRPPVAVDGIEIVVRDGLGWVTGPEGLLLAVDEQTLEPVRWTCLARASHGTMQVAGASVRYQDARSGAWCALDATTLDPSGPGTAPERQVAVPGIAGVVRRRNGRYERVTSDAVVPYGVVPVTHRWSALALHPLDPDALVVQAEDPAEPAVKQVWVAGPRGAHQLARLVTGPTTQIAVDPSHGVVFHLWHDTVRSTVRAMSARDGVERWSVEAPVDGVLIQGSAGGPVGWLTQAEDRLVFRWLGPDPPDGPLPNSVGAQVRVAGDRRCDGVDSDLAEVEALCAARRWRDVIAHLTPRATATPSHLHHLLGYAGIMALDAAAIEHLPRAGSTCDLQALTLLASSARWLANEPEGGAASDERPSGGVGVLRKMIEALREADAALSIGDPEAAWRALDRPMVWRSGDRQSAGRRLEAVAAMERPPPLRAVRARWSYDRATGDVPCPDPWTTARLSAARASVGGE